MAASTSSKKAKVGKVRGKSSAVQDFNVHVKEILRYAQDAKTYHAAIEWVRSVSKCVNL